MIRYSKRLIHKDLTAEEKRLYNIWHSMRGRCNTPSVTFYRHYGGRGITVCERWMESFENFVTDVGLPPGKGYDLDRIDNNGNYEPANVRWITHKKNTQNTRTNRPITIEIDGVPTTKLASQWADEYGISRPTMCVRLKLGWTGMALLSKPQKSYAEKYKIGDEERTVKEWARQIGVSEFCFRDRLARGLSADQLLAPPTTRKDGLSFKMKYANYEPELEFVPIKPAPVAVEIVEDK